MDLFQFFFSQPSSAKAAPEKPAGKQGRQGGKQEPAKAAPQRPPQPEEDEVEWSADTSPAAVEQRRRDLLGNRDRLSQKDGEGEGDEEGAAPKTPGLWLTSFSDNILAFEIPAENPIPALAAYFATDPKPEDCLNLVKATSAKLQWSETNMLKSIFAALFPGDQIRKDFYKKTDILSLVSIQFFFWTHSLVLYHFQTSKNCSLLS